MSTEFIFYVIISQNGSSGLVCQILYMVCQILYMELKQMYNNVLAKIPGSEKNEIQ